MQPSMWWSIREAIVVFLWFRSSAGFFLLGLFIPSIDSLYRRQISFPVLIARKILNTLHWHVPLAREVDDSPNCSSMLTCSSYQTAPDV